MIEQAINIFVVLIREDAEVLNVRTFSSEEEAGKCCEYMRKQGMHSTKVIRAFPLEGEFEEEGLYRAC